MSRSKVSDIKCALYVVPYIDSHTGTTTLHQVSGRETQIVLSAVKLCK